MEMNYKYNLFNPLNQKIDILKINLHLLMKRGLFGCEI